jgi:glycosyltransferase involved in cell wall biosynthesis
MEALSICIATQTPLVQFSAGANSNRAAATFPVDLTRLKEGTDYRFSPGGVTRMVYPLARRMLEEGRWRHVDWVALNPRAPPTVELPGMTLHHVMLDEARLAAYGQAKEAMWSTIHGLHPPGRSRDLFWTDDYGDFTYYNRRTAETIAALDEREDFDAFYIHDFQLLPLGGMLRSLKPKVFRWHIPFDGRTIPGRWQPLVRTHLSAYDVVIVSSERYRTALRRFGFHGRVERVYPFVDPDEYGDPDEETVRADAAARGIAPNERVVLVVGRMDPTKRQDRVIEAFAALPPHVGPVRLVLVGNGSFSGSGAGLGLSKSAVWRRQLEETAERLGVRDRVLFTGHVSQSELDCLYARSLFTVLPSGREGFGLVVVESWIHGRPALVSREAGVADLVVDGENGVLFDPEDPGSLVDGMVRLLEASRTERSRLALAARATANACTLDRAVTQEASLLGEVVLA